MSDLGYIFSEILTVIGLLLANIFQFLRKAYVVTCAIFLALLLYLDCVFWTGSPNLLILHYVIAFIIFLGIAMASIFIGKKSLTAVYAAGTFALIKDIVFLTDSIRLWIMGGLGQHLLLEWMYADPLPKSSIFRFFNVAPISIVLGLLITAIIYVNVKRSNSTPDSFIAPVFYFFLMGFAQFGLSPFLGKIKTHPIVGFLILLILEAASVALYLLKEKKEEQEGEPERKDMGLFNRKKRLNNNQVIQQPVDNVGYDDVGVQQQQQQQNNVPQQNQPVNNTPQQAASNDSEAQIAIARENAEMRLMQSQKTVNVEMVQRDLAMINGMIGLEDAKEQVNNLVDSLIAEARRKEAGIHTRSSVSRHMLFLGNPGTGKTEVAKMIGNLLCHLGVVPCKRFVTALGSDLVGRYIGETPIKTRLLFYGAVGGVLFIDEAYSILPDPDNPSNQGTFGFEAVDALVPMMEEYRDNTVVILAGYTKKMENFLDTANPGLKSRIPKQNWIYFKDYEPRDLFAIFKKMIASDGYKFAPEFDNKALKSVVDNAARDESFGNARGVRNLVGEVEANIDKRVAAGQPPYDAVVTSDITSCSYYKRKDTDGGTEDLETLLKRMDDMVGLAPVKKRVHEIVGDVKVAKRLGGDMPVLHMMFTGNPGTGKTTIAEFLAKIFNQLGVLPKSTFRQIKRQDVINEYPNAAGRNMRLECEKAMGGILFIDEAYNLYGGPDDTGGRQALDALMTIMEENRHELLVIFAGYEKELEFMLSANAGLKSRIPYTIDFPDYSIEDKARIFYKMAKAQKVILSGNLSKDVYHLMKVASDVYGDTFGNARGVRNLLEKVQTAKNRRLASRPDFDKLPEKMIRTVTREDVIAVESSLTNTDVDSLSASDLETKLKLKK